MPKFEHIGLWVHLGGTMLSPGHIFWSAVFRSRIDQFQSCEIRGAAGVYTLRGTYLGNIAATRPRRGMGPTNISNLALIQNCA